MKLRAAGLNATRAATASSAANPCTRPTCQPLGRLAWPNRADWPIILSVGGLQLSCFFALANLGVQSVPAGRSGVLTYTAVLWMVPLSLLVGEKVGRRAYGMEIDPLYVDAAIRRWQDFSKRDAVLAATGQTFSEVAADRSSPKSTRAK